MYSEANEINWSDNAPRGGKTVLNRAIKEGSAVPLFLGQTVINSLRDMGYNSTTSALCELIDNSIQWKAQNIRIYIQQDGVPGNYRTNLAVLDDGCGMAPNVLKVALSFGGSLNYDNRAGIGRYGMGMKTAALSMCPVLDVYSWQEAGAFYNMTLDVAEIGKNSSNMITLPEPELFGSLPQEIQDILLEPMAFPRNADDQILFSDRENLANDLGASGTLIFLPDCDRLSYAKAQTLVEDAMKEIGRVYRRFIAQGISIFVNNREVEVFDPTYSMEESRHVQIKGLDEKQSRMIVSKTIPIPNANAKGGVSDLKVRLYALPIEEWSALPTTIRKNKLRLYDGQFISFMRNDREVYAGQMARIQKPHGDLNWIRVSVDFSGDLDEAMGVAANKQGVRPKAYVQDAIREAINNEIRQLRERNKRFQAEQSSARQTKRNLAISKANDAENFQAKEITEAAPTNEKEALDLEANYRALALRVKDGDETDDQAYERVKNGKFFIVYKHDKYWPFYDVENLYGKLVLTINTAHAFYTELYEPISKLAASASDEENISDESNGDIQEAVGALTSLQLLLLSMARTQAQMISSNEGYEPVFDSFRRYWSDTFKQQLETK